MQQLKLGGLVHYAWPCHDGHQLRHLALMMHAYRVPMVDYDTNIDHKECVQHACIYLHAMRAYAIMITYECDHMPSWHACDINLPYKTDCNLLREVSGC